VGVCSTLVYLTHVFYEVAYSSFGDTHALSNSGMAFCGFDSLFGAVRFTTHNPHPRNLGPRGLIVRGSHATVKNVMVGLRTVDSRVSCS
jgi:hypothetical protein